MLQYEIKNRTVFIGDNLEILRGINSGSIDLIYLDPPFNKKKVFTATIGSQAEGVGFSDIFRDGDVKEEWLCDIKEGNKDLHNFLAGIKNIGHKSNFYYLCYMAIRLIEMRRILKDSGSLYLHCDTTMSHYLKIVLDCVFGSDNFRNEIVWERGTASGHKARANKFVSNHDVIYFYVKSNKAFTFSKQYTPYTQEYLKKRFVNDDNDDKGKYRLQGKNQKQYLKDSKGKPVSDIWVDIFPINPMAKEKQGYPTQKPLALLDRIIRASTNEGDVVLDPFCGCGTTCVASENLSRQWVGIDISEEAKKLIYNRLKGESGIQAVEGDYIPVRTDNKIF